MSLNSPDASDEDEESNVVESEDETPKPKKAKVTKEIGVSRRASPKKKTATKKKALSKEFVEEDVF